jgi:hypothetical protein
MSLIAVEWAVDILARSSIVHREDYTDNRTDSFTLLRREKIMTAAGDVLQVPIVSGSSLRGVLRRIGEELTAAVLNYEDTGLPVPAAHLLTNGGRLAKSAKPLTDEQERRLKTLIPLIAVFGGSASGRIMGGLTAVGKVVPEVAELAHILERPPHSTPLPAIRTLAEESFTHLSDHRPTNQAPPRTDGDETTSPLGRFSVETIPAGTRLQSYVRIANATEQQVAFLRDVLNTFAEHGHLGGRIAAGHGRISATLTPDVRRGKLPDDSVDWATELAEHRDDALAALSEIT